MMFVLLLSMTITAYAKDSTKYHLGRVVSIKEDKSQATVMAGADYNVIKTYRAKVLFLDGPHKGETVNAIAYEQSFKGYTIKYKVGEKVIVTEDLDNNFNFNTAISAIMELVNAMYAHKDKVEAVNADLANELTHNLVLLLAPFVPHITEELWHEFR